MTGCNGEGAGINSFALVSYLPQPLAGFLDQLRKDLAPEYHSKAHVTVLPPRPLVCPPEEARLDLAAGLRDFHPFRIELGEIEIFPITNVIYLSVTAGAARLKWLHERLNAGCFAFEEPFPYHPHVTLGQDLESGVVAAAAEMAAARWRDFAGERGFSLDRLTFVQNTLSNHWIDLHAFRLAERVRI